MNKKQKERVNDEFVKRTDRNHEYDSKFQTNLGNGNRCKYVHFFMSYYECIVWTAYNSNKCRKDRELVNPIDSIDPFIRNSQIVVYEP
ncbi:MAG: hypothetical protein MJZ93_05660 [Paludibacteraceae bacterium]|nr:hypothetical protein [Paludibacteraceae bacterium]